MPKSKRRNRSSGHTNLRRTKRRVVTWTLGLLGSLVLAFAAGSRSLLLPGASSDGHYLIERSCSSCHVPFRGVPNASCSACHRVELARDSHPATLFDDPRWAEDLTKIDATRCVTCHREHEISERGVTIDPVFCTQCHGAVLTQRASHAGFSPESCGDGGCHNYHDGSPLRRDQLVEHLGEPDLKTGWGSPPRSSSPHRPEGSRGTEVVLPAGLPAPARVVDAWSNSAHALGAGCPSCHVQENELVLRPDRSVCRSCHRFEVETFLRGKHGIRLRLGLEPLRPRDARLPMKPGAVTGDLVLDCGTCHDPHSVDTRRAATEACLGCHDDRHSTSFEGSPHAREGGAAPAGRRPSSHEVTCATCHLPRVVIEGEDGPRVAVSHDNTLTLWPPDRMARMVCDDCHGMEMALTSLVDEQSVADNFTAPPRGELRTFSMVAHPTNPKEELAP